MRMARFLFFLFIMKWPFVFMREIEADLRK